MYATVATASACSLSLTVAMDGSASVDPQEHALQLGGLANALKDPEVVDAIELVGGIWFSSFEWSGRTQQALQLDWTFIEDQAGADAASARLFKSPRLFGQSTTALGEALVFGVDLLNAAPEYCLRRVIDLAGDGVSNEGLGPDAVHGLLDQEQIIVNGLVIAGSVPNPIGYYRTRVIRGPGAFLEIADGFSDYERAMKRKLIKEITAGNFSRLGTPQ
ncbi:DUF1194 domain-containing protein [Roseibium hamelinense]|nr:DUF1194 domain-containing protein [Roseibium hamelinense]